jgi:hypothetical protein
LLRKATDNGKKKVTQIETFDVMSIRSWRDRILNIGVVD